VQSHPHDELPHGVTISQWLAAERNWTVPEYVQHMANWNGGDEQTWGGALEIVLASKLRGFTVAIFELVVGGYEQVSFVGGGATADFNLVFKGGHYDFLMLSK